MAQEVLTDAHTLVVYEVLGSFSAVVEDPSLLECDFALIDT